MNKNILIIAGEPSGDARASEVIRELKKLLPGVSFWGIGGDCMQEQGVELIEHVRRFSMVGVWEVLKNLSRIREQYVNVTKNIRERKPILAILVDYPGFNLKLAAFLNRENIPVIYYIIPQVWAWGSGRVKLLKRYVDKALVLFKFEKQLLGNFGIDAEFVGHPLLDAMGAFEARQEGAVNREESVKSKDYSTIALLPGSRKTEVQGLLPLMLETAKKIHQQKKDVRFAVAENSNVEKSLYDSAFAKHGEFQVSRVTDNTFSALNSCDFAIVASGTATLETAIMGKPMVITYRTSPFTYILFRLFAKTRHIGLVNIIAGKEAVPELLQHDATPEKLSQKVLEIINDERRMIQTKNELKKVKDSLGEKGAGKKAAKVISEFIKEKVSKNDINALEASDEK